MAERKIDVRVPVIIPITYVHKQESDLFEGISFFIDASLYIIIDGLRKYPQELGKMIVVNGGEVHPQFNFEETTYILSKGLPQFRIQKFSESQLISPDWVSECVKKQQISETKEFLQIEKIQTNDNGNDSSSSEDGGLLENESENVASSSPSSSKHGKVKIFIFDCT